MVFETIFETDNGKKFTFGRGGGNYYGMSVGNGMEIALGTSQGFSQIGETVQTQGVGGRVIDVKGELYGDIGERKNALRNACAPMTAGKLIFQGKYFIRVYVKSTPTFSAKREDGRFMMQFFAPFPYFSALEEKAYNIGAVTREFRFPVNYGVPHRFGTRAAAKATNVVNDGDVQVAFRLDVRVTGMCENIVITNLNTRKFLKITGAFKAGERITVYHNQDNAIQAELINGDTVADILGRIDDDSNLFALDPGDNLLAATDDNGGMGLSVQFTFQPARAAMYEDQFV